MPQRHIVYYSGTVQGVGFRYTTVGVARGFEVTGYVRNLSDGRVEVVVEGELPEVNAFLKAMRESDVGGYVENIEQSTEDAKGDLGLGFTIRY